MVTQSQLLIPENVQEVRYERIDPLVGGSWDFHVSKYSCQSVFHRSAWARILAETYGHRPYYLRVLVGGIEAALVPLMEVRSPVTGIRGISLPFSDFAGPLWNPPCRSEVVRRFLLDFATERNWHHLEFRGDSNPDSGAEIFRSYHTHQLDLRPGITEIARSLPVTTKRSIRKAEQSGLNVRISNTSQDLEIFYELHVLTRRRHGLPPQPPAFFQSIGRHLIESGMGVTVLAFRSGEAVAGAVFLRSGDQAIFKYGASDKAHWSVRPNHRVMWSAIQYLVEVGCQHLDFGRTSSDDTGLIRFKQSWGASAGTLLYHRYDIGRHAWVTRHGALIETMPLVFGHLPLALNRFAGRLIYPHLD